MGEGENRVIRIRVKMKVDGIFLIGDKERKRLMGEGRMGGYREKNDR